MSEFPAYQYGAWLVPSTRYPDGIVDGDTLHCGIDLGCDVANFQTIRLYGINCPEMSTDEGKVAKRFAQDWCLQHCPEGKFVLHTVKDKREKYGRYLGVIYAYDGACLNDDLVTSGNAVVYMMLVLDPAPDGAREFAGRPIPVSVDSTKDAEGG